MEDQQDTELAAVNSNSNSSDDIAAMGAVNSESAASTPATTPDVQPQQEHPHLAPIVQQLKCLMCADDRPYKNSQMLEAHLYSYHFKCHPFSCEHCDAEEQTKKHPTEHSLRLHYETHHGPMEHDMLIYAEYPSKYDSIRDKVQAQLRLAETVAGRQQQPSTGGGGEVATVAEVIWAVPRSPRRPPTPPIKPEPIEELLDPDDGSECRQSGFRVYRPRSPPLLEQQQCGYIDNCSSDEPSRTESSMRAFGESSPRNPCLVSNPNLRRSTSLAPTSSLRSVHWAPGMEPPQQSPSSSTAAGHFGSHHSPAPPRGEAALVGNHNVARNIGWVGGSGAVGHRGKLRQAVHMRRLCTACHKQLRVDPKCKRFLLAHINKFHKKYTTYMCRRCGQRFTDLSRNKVIQHLHHQHGVAPNARTTGDVLSYVEDARQRLEKALPVYFQGAKFD